MLAYLKALALHDLVSAGLMEKAVKEKAAWGHTILPNQTSYIPQTESWLANAKAAADMILCLAQYILAIGLFFVILRIFQIVEGSFSEWSLEQAHLYGLYYTLAGALVIFLRRFTVEFDD